MSKLNSYYQVYNVLPPMTQVHNFKTELEAKYFCEDGYDGTNHNPVGYVYLLSYRQVWTNLTGQAFEDLFVEYK